MSRVFFLSLLLAASSYAGPHMHRSPSGEDSRLFACRKGENDQVTPKQQEIINNFVGTHRHRLQHALWHAVRSGLSHTEMETIQSAYGRAWGGDHNLCPPPDTDPNAREYRVVGEDFLYMHRQMINAIRREWDDAAEPCLKGWQNMKETQSWPLPDDVRTGAKSDDAFNTFLKWDQELQDRKWLSTISLSQLGYAVEFTIHNNLHMRYATERAPEGFDEANENGGAPFPFDGNFPKNWRFDSPKYNWLADPYGAALNPVFWKIHGYVDHLIDVWLAANKKKYDSISENCKGNKRCYEWKGTWVGEEGHEAAPKAYKADTAPLDAKSIAEFTRKRIANQRAGVLTDGIKAPDSFGSKEAAPLSPFEIAKKRLCNID